MGVRNFLANTLLPAGICALVVNVNGAYNRMEGRKEGALQYQAMGYEVGKEVAVRAFCSTTQAEEKDCITSAREVLSAYERKLQSEPPARPGVRPPARPNEFDI